MQNRREFIKVLTRRIFLGGLLLGSGYLILRNNSDESESCKYDFLCRNCKDLKSCSLPEAKEYKKNTVSDKSNS